MKQTIKITVQSASASYMGKGPIQTASAGTNRIDSGWDSRRNDYAERLLYATTQHPVSGLQHRSGRKSPGRRQGMPSARRADPSASARPQQSPQLYETRSNSNATLSAHSNIYPVQRRYMINASINSSLKRLYTAVRGRDARL